MVEPNKEPKVEIIQNNLRDKQHIVGGLIEYTYIPNENDVSLICNEEGKLLGLPPNRIVGNDIIAGTFLIVGDNDTGEDRSLTDEQIDYFKDYFSKEKIIENNTENYDYDIEYGIY